MVVDIRLEDIPLDAKHTPEIREKLIAEAEGMLRELESKNTDTGEARAAPLTRASRLDRIAHGT